MAVFAVFVGMTAFAQEDITDQYLTNADLSSLTGWDYGDPFENGTFTYTAYDPKAAVPVIEFYHSWSQNAGQEIGSTKNFHFTQTIKLPAGSYRLAVNGFYREGNGNGTNTKAYIFAGAQQMYMHGLTSAEQGDVSNGNGPYAAGGNSDLKRAAYAFSQGKFSNEFDFNVEINSGDENVTVENGVAKKEITIGFRGYIDTYCSWCILGPVKLYKYDKDAYLTDYRNKVAEAQELLKKPMNAEVKAALQATLVDERSLTSSEQVKEQIRLINEAMAAAETSIAIYEQIIAYLEYTQNNVAGDYSSISTKISNGAYDTADPAIIEIKNVRNGIIFKSSNPDMSKLIDNAGFELGNTNYWTVGTSSDTGARSTTNTTYIMSNSEGDYLFNTWWQGIPITQNVGKLPEGKYLLSAIVASDGARIYGKVNDAHDVYVDTSDKTVGLPLNYVFTLDEEKEVTIGVVGGNDDEGKTYTEAGYFWYKADNFKITKYVPVTAINAEDVTVEVAGTAPISATVVPDNASLPEITYTSGDERTATVDKDGVVTGVAVGKTTITLKADEITKVINVTVKAPAILPKSITLNPNKVDLKLGSVTTATITANVLPEGANQEVTFASSNENIATVDAEGNVTATGIGNATITVTSKVKNDVKATATVTVTAADAPKYYEDEIADGREFWIMNAATGKYLGGANSWGTRASLIEHGIPFKAVVAGEGIYKLDSYVSNEPGSNYLNGEWIDQFPVNFTITQNRNGSFSIGVTNTTTDEGTGETITTTKYIKAKLSNTEVDLNGEDVNDPFAQWYFLSKTDRISMLEDGLDDDATFFIKDYNFGRNNTQYSAWKFESSNKNNNGEESNWCVESYKANFNMSQTLGVPNGTYELTAQGFYRVEFEEGDAAFPVFFANDQEKTFFEREKTENNMRDASASFSAGKYKISPITVVVKDHTLKIGAKNEERAGLWCIWDNFELKCVSLDEEQNEEIAVTIGDTGYATLYYSNLNLMNEKVTPNTVTVEGHTAIPTPLPKQEAELPGESDYYIIPAGTPVLLQGAPGEYIFDIATYEDLSSYFNLDKNELVGTDEDEVIPAKDGYRYFILNTLENVIGFYFGGPDGGTFTNLAHKAYLPVKNEESANATVITLVTPDGITTVQRNDTDDPNAPAYNLAGQRVNSSYNGVVIVNGKKYIRK